MMQDVLTTEEAAEMIKLSKNTILAMARKGELPAIELGNRWLFVKEQVMAYLCERAKAEQIKRQEMTAAAELEKSDTPQEKRKRGRPGNKIDLT